MNNKTLPKIRREKNNYNDLKEQFCRCFKNVCFSKYYKFIDNL